MPSDGHRTSTLEPLEHEVARSIHRILVMYYMEQKTQAEIARITGLSVAKVNRMIRQGRDHGMVEISIRPPSSSTHDLEQRLAEAGGLAETMVVPTASEDVELNLKAVGQAAARFLLSHLKDGDTICISGGKGVTALVEGLRPSRRYDVTVVPATGLVQGRHYIDVNHAASEMAGKLGGQAYQIHAPMFADSEKQRDILRKVSAVADVLQRARRATIAVVGIGSVLAKGSSYLDFGLSTSSAADRKKIAAANAQGELLAHLLDGDGRLADYARNDLLVGLAPGDLIKIPFSIGVAGGPAKVVPIGAVLKGRYLKSLVTDERTAGGVIDRLQGAG